MLTAAAVFEAAGVVVVVPVLELVGDTSEKVVSGAIVVCGDGSSVVVAGAVEVGNVVCETADVVVSSEKVVPGVAPGPVVVCRFRV